MHTAYTHTYIHTYIHTYMHTYIHVYIHCTYIHTYIHTYVQTYVRTYTHAHTRACMHVCRHTCIYIHTYMPKCICNHTHLNTYNHVRSMHLSMYVVCMYSMLMHCAYMCTYLERFTQHILECCRILELLLLPRSLGTTILAVMLVRRGPGV